MPVPSSSGGYPHGEAQEMGKKHSQELNVKVVDYPNMVYAPRQDWQGMTSEEYGEYGAFRNYTNNIIIIED